MMSRVGEKAPMNALWLGVASSAASPRVCIGVRWGDLPGVIVRPGVVRDFASPACINKIIKWRRRRT